MPAAKDEHQNGAELVHCVDRVAELPVVAAMYGGILGVYNSMKNSQLPLVSRTLDFAEATAKLAVAQGYPVALKFKEPIGYIDMLACKGLDALEHNVPLVKNAPEEIYADAKAYVFEKVQLPLGMVTRIKDMGVSKAGAATEMGREKLIQAAKAHYAQRALQNLEAAVTTLDGYVDKYIPADESELKDLEGFELENCDPAFASIGHAAALTNKIRHRIYKLTLAKARAAQKKCTDAFDHLPAVHPSAFVDYVRAQLTSGTHALTEASNLIWQETATLTPARAAQAVTSGLTLIEARTVVAARTLLQYFKLTYDVGNGPEKKVQKKGGKKHKH